MFFVFIFFQPKVVSREVCSVGGHTESRTFKYLPVSCSFFSIIYIRTILHTTLFKILPAGIAVAGSGLKLKLDTAPVEAVKYCRQPAGPPISFAQSYCVTLFF